MTDLAAIVDALEREHRTNLPAHFLIAADHPARLECPTCALLADTPSVEPLDVERLAEALKEYDAGRLQVPFAPSHVLSPDQSPSRFHRAWAKTLLDYAARLLADTPSVEPLESRLAEIAESVLADLASRPAITTWATPDVKVGDWFRVVVVTADEDKVIASLVSMDRSSVEPAGTHQPGDNHDYRVECTVCGERGMIRLSVDPGRAGEREALNAGTHEPAVDDFGNQYLLPTQASDSPEKTT